MRRPLIAGNWKMNKTIAEAVLLVKEIKGSVSENSTVDVLVAPTFTALSSVKAELQGSSVMLAAQDLFWEESGAYTGQISPNMVKDAGCSFVIIGHSERRQFFGETDETVNKKINAALKADITPIFCVGETLDQREQGKTADVIKQQVVQGLANLSGDDAKNIVVAYEPIWAIGTGKTATPEQANDVHHQIRTLLASLFGEDISQNMRILYGGSVKPENATELLSEKEIDGALVGGASLKTESFSGIVKAASML